VDVAEIYYPGAFGDLATAFNLVAGPAHDLRLGHDFSTVEGQQKVWHDLEREDPELTDGSPPCEAFSSLQNLNPKGESYAET